MRIASTLRRLGRLGPADAALLGEALMMLAAASAAVALLPFHRVTRLASSGSRARPAAQEGAGARNPARVARAVQAWARRVPWRAVCFQIGLATHWMLRRRGLDSVLHYGVGRGSADGLAAHVWVTLEGQIVVGEYEAEQFACLAQFPPGRELRPDL
jgi:hypothetical protein